MEVLNSNNLTYFLKLNTQRVYPNTNRRFSIERLRKVLADDRKKFQVHFN